MSTLSQLFAAFIAFLPFSLKLVLGDLTFALHFQRKSRFVLRVFLSIFLQTGISVLLYFLLQSFHSWIITNTIYYFLLFFLSALFLRLLFTESMTVLLPCAVGGYMVEHISTQVFVLLFHNLQQAMKSGSVKTDQSLLSLIAQILVFLIVSGLIWYFFARKATPMDRTPELQKHLLVLSVVTLMVVLVLSSARDQFAEESFRLMVITRLFSIFSCLFLLFIRYDIVEKGRLEAERAELSRVISMERKQFKLSQENIELINIKCHDMRHKIDLWERRGAAVDRSEIAEIRKMIGIYDSGIRTGNEVLDTILTERSLYCEKAGIRMSCMVDGEKLGFLSTGDLCSLFGNAIENAIEAAGKVADPDNRNVSLQVRENRGMLIITVENSYLGDVKVEDGLPKSSKGDDENHGFGIKSIRNVAEKYGGEMNILVDEIFHLTVLIPIPV